MAYLIRRKAKKRVQIMMDDFRITGSGTFRDVDEKTDEIRLPLLFMSKMNAEQEMEKWKAEEPDWKYKVVWYYR